MNSLWILPNNPLLWAGVFSTCNTHQDFSPPPPFFSNSLVTAKRTNLAVLVFCTVQATTRSLFTSNAQYNINLSNSCTQTYFKTIRSVTLNTLDKEVLVKVNLPFSLLHPSYVCYLFQYLEILTPAQPFTRLADPPHIELCSSTLLENGVKKIPQKHHSYYF